MKQTLKNIILVSYLKNVGVRRLCMVLGVLFALVPAYFFATNLYVSEGSTLAEAVVSAPEKQQRYVFEHYPYKCNFCDLETDFEHWRATFGSWKHVNNMLHTDCSKLRNPASCNSEKKYLAQKVRVGYFNFAAFSYLAYALLVFFIPFLVACAIQWIILGFVQGKTQKKEKK